MKLTDDFWERFIQNKREETANCGAFLFVFLGVYLLIDSCFFNSYLKNEAIVIIWLSVFALLVSCCVDVYRIKKRSYGRNQKESMEIVEALWSEKCLRKISEDEYFAIANSIGDLVRKNVCCGKLTGQSVYVYKYQAHPFDDWRFFHVRAESQRKANKKARIRFTKMFQTGQTTMNQFYVVKNKKS